MRFDIYCDESRPDLLGSRHPHAEYMVIGSFWLATDERDNYKSAIHELRNKHMVGGETKWQKVSPSRKSYYEELVDWFFEQGANLRFRCIAVERQKVNLLQFHENDQELGFYKFYYQMLHHWIFDYNEYTVFCDFKSNRQPDRLHVLRRCLEASNLSSRILRVQTVRSRESVLMQFADVLTGAVGARLNKTLRPKSAKEGLVLQLESKLGRQLSHTVKAEQKFNVFVINLRGGW